MVKVKVLVLVVVFLARNDLELGTLYIACKDTVHEVRWNEISYRLRLIRIQITNWKPKRHN